MAGAGEEVVDEVVEGLQTVSGGLPLLSIRKMLLGRLSTMLTLIGFPGSKQNLAAACC